MAYRVSGTHIFLRPVKEPEDMLLLQHIYATSRDYETRYWGFDEPLLTRFLTDQFLIQHRQYRKFPDADLYIVENAVHEALGRFYVGERGEREIRVMDIALLPAHRRCGIGRVLLTWIMGRAEREGKRVTLHVEKNNPARGFYEKLGFKIGEPGDVYDFMTWPV